MQSELDQWQTERQRLRSILHNQQSRQSRLEEQNYMLREQRSRLQEEHSRLHEQTHRVNDRNGRLRDDLQSLQEAQSNLSNLASAITEVGRDSYTTTGAGPSRQRLYDWAATRHYGRPDGTEIDGDGSSPVGDMSGEVDSVPRRELERALRHYRTARSNFRSGRQPGTDVGAVPTASALRAYWNEEPNETYGTYRSEDSESSRTPFALSDFVEQHRNERQRRHLEVIRRQNEQRRNENQPRSSQQTGLRSNLHISDAFVRVRNTIKYLSALRHIDQDHGLELSRAMGLETLHEYGSTITANHLPLTVKSLPAPQPSSWLTSGMTWHGLQSTDREPARPAVLTRRQRREALGVSMARNRPAEDRSTSLVPSDFVPTHTPLDTNRYSSSFMQDSEGRWGFDNEPDSTGLPEASSFDPLSYHQPHSNTHPTPSTAEVDHWPVTVTLHSVDFNAMTVSGTMRASQLPDKMVSQNPGDLTPTMKSMESYFLGEIIDFRQHTLETLPSNPFSDSPYQYRSGGVDVDACYWARLGPFKREIERHSCMARGVNGKVWDIKTKPSEKYLDSLTIGNLGMGVEEIERMEGEKDEVMARCLGNESWLQEKLGAKNGEWVLMRWKEKCFVDPVMTPTDSIDTNATPTSTETTPRLNHDIRHSYSDPQDRRTMTLSDNTSAHQQWGLTISGFYYVALNRVTGELDGLYFDPGSQPFQSLRMVPQDSGRKISVSMEDDGGDFVDSRKNGGLMPGLGVRKYFPAVEFR